MSRFSVAIAVSLALQAQATETNPVTKVVGMLSELQGTIVSQANSAQKEYDEYVAYCQDRSQSIGHEIKTAKANKESLEATIEEETATIGTLKAKIEDLAADVASNEADLKRSTLIRQQEASNFEDEEHDLKTILDSLERAISHFSKGDNAALLQVNNAGSITDALKVMVEASVMSTEDASRLTSLMQEQSSAESRDGEEDADSELNVGAPSAAPYENQSGGVVSTLEALYEKAETQLSKVRESEASALQNFQQLKQSLENEIKLAGQDMHAAKVSLAESQETSSVASGDLDVTAKDLNRDVDAKEALHHECMDAAQEFQTSVNTRNNELAALAAAKKSIEENSNAATEQTYLQVSFTQVSSRAHSRGAHSGTEVATVVHKIRLLSTKTKSPLLAQLASRMSSALRLGAFDKVKGLINGMIAQLEAERDSDISHKAYCDKETASTDAQKEDTTSELSSLLAKKDQKQAASVKLKELMQNLRKELATISKFTASAETFRQEEESKYKKNRADMEKGLNGIRLALKTLKEHYGSAQGAEGGIISLLEVVESDFSQGLANLIVNEETTAHYYESQVKKNFELETATKEADLQYKIKEFRALDKALADTEGDVSDVKSRLDAVVLYEKGIKASCTSLPLEYEGRQGRRDEELRGLKEALDILDGNAVPDASLLELGASHKLRGARHHSA